MKRLGGCAKGHADADFLGALGDGIGDDGVDAERSENKGEEREATEQENDEAAGRSGFVHELLKSANVRGRKIGIEGLEGFANSGRELGSRERSADDEVHGRVVIRLQDGEIKFRAGFLLEGEMADVTDDADDCALGTIRLDNLADGILARP